MINDRLLQVVLSNAVCKEECSKIKVRPIVIKGELMFQQTKYCGTKVLHDNYQEHEIKEKLLVSVAHDFKQAEFTATEGSAIVLVSKKGKMTIKKKKAAPNHV